MSVVKSGCLGIEKEMILLEFSMFNFSPKYKRNSGPSFNRYCRPTGFALLVYVLQTVQNWVTRFPNI